MEYGKEDGLKSTDTLLSYDESGENIFMNLRVLYTDLVKRSMKVYIAILPNGAYFNESDFTWNKTVEFQFLHKSLVAKKGSTIEPVTFEIPLQTGNLKDYPFDKYTSDIAFAATDNSTKKSIPLTIYSNVYKQSISTKFIRDRTGDLETADENLQYYIINIKRTNIVYAFCFFISVVTWGLTILVLNIGFDCMFFKREIPPTLLSVGIVMLFAMPTLRKTQPDIPDIGCAIDFLCFIWCEVLIGIASCMVLYSWLLRWKVPV
ncbi:hypothetical protein CONCODRAFT_12688 [Conidiobolus coronatus NRRL 28638]|uniref:Uncharacterized protein n=1 Tax=Conidiobolus coronatus (strain ATCC 28846 / CBS 209.66 / NRRL 28638) TaxID=796925 RepID=A0A137NSC0_CONC2|nr:hypothetical protein CONCODRAFT_12688 [Conidiobolus coronatus NRRL 28638]|eukprot:KXN65659.1 hypothetical protein CONCODRAFT_12688 [Conidiobolus coronatus NRRL 28638]